MEFSVPADAVVLADKHGTTLLLAWLGGVLLTLPLELLLQPTTHLRGRPTAAWCIHLGIWSLLFGCLLLLTWRPVFAATAVLAFYLLVVLVNNAKFRALQEPFLFSDFGLFSQALRHPRLYLPFLGAGPALAIAAAVALAVSLGMTLETALTDGLGMSGLLTGVAACLLLAALSLTVGQRLAPEPSLLPHDDLRRLGLAASLWLYWRLEHRPLPPATSSLPETQERTNRGTLPDIVAVQSESFCDARRLWHGIRPGLFANLDRTVATASRHGRLTVPAWGANTMRTEFGFLTGIAADRLGVHRFNPYRRYARRTVPSLASWLRTLGYHTVCIHPHPASFFSRDQVYPRLGFDEFIDVRHFDRGDTCGPYICDAAVTRMIRQVLDSATKPVFVFAITMENHGPLHLEKVSSGDVEHLYSKPPPADFSDLGVYLRHLENADVMLGELTDKLRHRPRPGALCWFGDHVPSMPQVYARTGHTDGRTDYLIWRQDQEDVRYQDLAVEDLAAVLLEVSGLAVQGNGIEARP